MIKDGKIILDAPKFPVVRYTYEDDRHITVDFRGIRNPNKLLQGILNPTKGVQKTFVSPEHLKCMIDEYFESCNGPFIDKQGHPIHDNTGMPLRVQVRPWTLSGLALYLGLRTCSLKKYRTGEIDTILDELQAKTSDKLTFAKVLAQAKQKIESGAEARLYDKDGYNGARFVLDNAYGWYTHKEQSDIRKDAAMTELKQQELALKKQLIDDGMDDDNLTINIIRKEKD